MGRRTGLDIEVREFSVWRAAVLVTLAAALSVQLLWLTDTAALFEPLDSRAGRTSWIAAGAAFIVLVSGGGLWRVRPQVLRFDGVDWHCGSAAIGADQPVPGRVDVCLDLGQWMLLRFVPRASSRWARSTWLPMQRAALPDQWHGLRCALYAPRAAMAAAATDDGQHRNS